MQKEHYWLDAESMARLPQESISTIKAALESATENKSAILLNVSGAAPHENISTFVVLLGIAQYNDEWILTLAEYGVDLEFEDAEGAVVHQNEWTNIPQITDWFTLLRDHCPCSMPFLAQWEACFLTSASDIVASLDREEIEWHPENNTAVFHLSPMENQTVFSRVMLHCEQFLEYCNQTTVDAEPYITKLVGNFNFENTTYKQIKESWQMHRSQGKVWHM